MKDKIFKYENELLQLKDEYINMIFTTNKFQKEDFNLAVHINDEIENVKKNRMKLIEYLNTSKENIIFAHQTHSDNSKLVTKKDGGKGFESFEDGIFDTDCLYTYDKGLYLSCFFADCTPIYFYNKKINLIGIIHAGWQGTEKLIVANVMQKLKKDGVNIEDINIVFGPSIKKDSFEVDEDVYELFAQHSNLELDKIIFSTPNNKYHIDIVEFNKQLLINEGIKEENIKISSLDTYQEKNLYSFREDNKCGRMLGIISQS